MTRPDVAVIPSRFRGPPGSANGGYACGVLGCRMHDVTRVRLHEPPPLDTPMLVRATAPGRAELVLDDRTIASCQPADRTWAPASFVAYERAVSAAKSFPWYDGHPFATCFVCGPERAEDDGLRIFPGVVAENRSVAAPWIPSASVCDASGRVQLEVVWAALDCPSWFGIFAFEPDVRYALLGELSVRIESVPRQDERHVVIGWAAGRDGRKLHGGAALYSDTGTLIATSSATWIELKTLPQSSTE